MTWKTLESAIALASCIAKDYLKYKTSDTKEKKALENDIEQNPEKYNNTVFADEANDGNKEFNNETFTDLEKNIKENPEDFVNSESDAIAKEAADLLDDDKRNDEISEDMYDKIRKENEDWANQLREKYKSQYQSEAPEDLFEGLTEDDVEWVSQMLDEVMSSGKKKRKTKEEKEANREWLEQTQAADAYAMNDPEQYKQVGAFLNPAADDVVDDVVEDTVQDDVVDDIVENTEEQPINEDTAQDDVAEDTEEQPINDEQPQNEEELKRRNSFLDKFKRSISVNPANGSFTAEETTETNKGGAIGTGINNINGQSGGVGVSAALDKSNDKKEIEMKEYKEQRNVDKELHYDDVPIEQMSSVNNPGANNGNTGNGETIKVPTAHSSFSVKKNELKGNTGHAYGKNKVELDKIKDDNDLEEVLKSLDDYSMFEPLVIENINDEILVNGHPLRMLSDGTLKYIENKLRK